MNPRRIVLALLVLFALAVGGIGLAVVLNPEPPPREVSYVIPAGTIGRLRAGQVVEVLPGRIELRTVDTLVIENQDVEPFSLGAFVIRAGETFRHRYSRVGTYGEACNLHPSGKIDIVVT